MSTQRRLLWSGKKTKTQQEVRGCRGDIRGKIVVESEYLEETGSIWRSPGVHLVVLSRGDEPIGMVCKAQSEDAALMASETEMLVIGGSSGRSLRAGSSTSLGTSKGLEEGGGGAATVASAGAGWTVGANGDNLDLGGLQPDREPLGAVEERVGRGGGGHVLGSASRR